MFTKQIKTMFPSARQEDMYDLWALLANIDEFYERIMMAPLSDEANLEVPIHEYGFFDDDYQKYSDPYRLEWEQPNIQLDLWKKEEQQEDRSVVVAERQGKNYIADFFEKHGSVLLSVSQQYWELLLFDILRELSNPKLSNAELEIRLFAMLKNVEAIKYLLTFRKEMVVYMHETKFWQQEKQIQKQRKGDIQETNHQILEKLGVGEVEIEKKLGLKEQKYDEDGNPRRRKQMANKDEMKVEHNPDDYIKMDQQQLKKFFPTSHREDLREYLKIRIDPIPKP